MRKAAIAWCVVLVFAGAAMAERVTDPPWLADPADPQWAGGSLTSQTFEFKELLTDPTKAVYVDNQWGDPELMPINADYPDWVPGTDPTGGEIPTWHIGPEGGIDILVFNDPRPNARKVIYCQITSDKAPSNPPSVPPAGPSAPGGTGSPVGPSWQLPNGWYVYTHQIDLPYNPPCEIIHYDFPECTNIAEIAIDTICVPEPMTLALLGVGAVALIRRKR